MCLRDPLLLRLQQFLVAGHLCRKGLGRKFEFVPASHLLSANSLEVLVCLAEEVLQHVNDALAMGGIGSNRRRIEVIERIIVGSRFLRESGELALVMQGKRSRVHECVKHLHKHRHIVSLRVGLYEGRPLGVQQVPVEDTNGAIQSCDDLHELRLIIRISLVFLITHIRLGLEFRLTLRDGACQFRNGRRCLLSVILRTLDEGGGSVDLHLSVCDRVLLLLLVRGAPLLEFHKDLLIFHTICDNLAFELREQLGDQHKRV
mmetsp:Transcript_28081/g.74251  ORF Transcript_28081/g.74251 Transcript_28081/m.74251 type:complete len:260 (+) Transcript_28081:1350-2129(+)